MKKLSVFPFVGREAVYWHSLCYNKNVSQLIDAKIDFLLTLSMQGWQQGGKGRGKQGEPGTYNNQTFYHQYSAHFTLTLWSGQFLHGSQWVIRILDCVVRKSLLCVTSSYLQTIHSHFSYKLITVICGFRLEYHYTWFYHHLRLNAMKIQRICTLRELPYWILETMGLINCIGP